MQPQDPWSPKPPPPVVSPYDFIQKTPYDPGPKSHKKRWIIIGVLVTSVLLLIGVAALVASQAGSNQPANTSNSEEASQTAAQLEAYTDSSAFTISYPSDFGVVPGDENIDETSATTSVAFYKDANDEELNGFGVEISEFTELETAPPKVGDDYTSLLKEHTRGQNVTNVRSEKIKTSGQDGIKTTADFNSDGTPTKITLIRAVTTNQVVVLWFTAEASNKAYLDQIDPILATFELH